MKEIIPEAALSQHIAVLGKTGSGKTFATKAALVEPALAAGRRVAIVDPTAAWWGLRSSRDGKGDGFPILVLGGDHGDLPLPALGGAAVARLIAEQGVSLVADTSLLTVGERTRWFIDFASTLYRLNRAPLQLVLDEAHMFAPQGKSPDVDAGRMLHAANTLGSAGRSRGIRVTMITQRPAKLHKDLLTCADTLIAMRVLAPQDRGAVKDWIDGCGDQAQGKIVLDSLANLQKGEGWVWFPEGGHLERSKFPAIKTFDSSATPEDGHERAAPKRAAEVDLSEIKKMLADAAAEAEANDPKRLRARIAELEMQVGGTGSIYTKADLEDARIEGFNAGAQAVVDRLKVQALTAHEAVDHIKKVIEMHPETSGPDFFRAAIAATGSLVVPPAPRPREAPAARKPRATGNTPSELPRPQQRILDTLAWLAGAGLERPDRIQVALLSEQSPKSSGYANNLSALRTADLVHYPAGNLVALTGAGMEKAQQPAHRVTSKDLHAALQRYLPRPQWAILNELIRLYPNSPGREHIAGLVNQSPNSSGYANNLSALRTLGFLEYTGGQGSRGVKATAVLFLK
jgi:hypothetical protein